MLSNRAIGHCYVYSVYIKYIRVSKTKWQQNIKDRMNNAISFEKFYLNCIFIAHTWHKLSLVHMFARSFSSGWGAFFKRNTSVFVSLCVCVFFSLYNRYYWKRHIRDNSENETNKKPHIQIITWCFLHVLISDRNFQDLFIFVTKSSVSIWGTAFFHVFIRVLSQHRNRDGHIVGTNNTQLKKEKQNDRKWDGRTNEFAQNERKWNKNKSAQAEKKKRKKTKRITQRRENQSISINRIGICACFIYKCYTFNSGISY